MDKQTLKFGDSSTADMILRLLDSEGAEYEKNPLYLHSQILRKCDFYETMLSERWSLDKQRPLPITVTSTHGLDNYIKCLSLMYSSQAKTKRFCFASVDDALHILPVAAQLLFHECVQECMQYLNAVRWTPAQAAELRNLLSSLQLNNFPTELAARLGMNLGKSDINDGLQFLEESLQQLLVTISVSNVPLDPIFKYASYIWSDSYYRNIVAESIVGYFHASSAVADMCSRVLVKALRFNIEFIKCAKNTCVSTSIDNAYANLLWLVDLIRRCDRELFGTVFKMFSEDVSLRNAVNRRTSTDMSVKHITDILMNGFLTPLGNGEIIIPTSIRVSFLSNWLNTMVKYIKIPKDLDTLEKRLVDVAETLPLSDQRRVIQIWQEASKSEPKVSGSGGVMEWWVKKLHDCMASVN